jgi:hypothetical protein
MPLSNLSILLVVKLLAPISIWRSRKENKGFCVEGLYQSWGVAEDYFDR